MFRTLDEAIAKAPRNTVSIVVWNGMNFESRNPHMMGFGGCLIGPRRMVDSRVALAKETGHSYGMVVYTEAE